MTTFKEFYKKGIGTIRAIEEDGEIWFNAYDVTFILGRKVSGAPSEIPDLVDDGDSKIIDVPCDREDYTAHVMCVNKCGLFTLLLAETFPRERCVSDAREWVARVLEIKKWVAGEIVPAMKA